MLHCHLYLLLENTYVMYEINRYLQLWCNQYNNYLRVFSFHEDTRAINWFIHRHGDLDRWGGGGRDTRGVRGR